MSKFYRRFKLLSCLDGSDEHPPLAPVSSGNGTDVFAELVLAARNGQVDVVSRILEDEADMLLMGGPTGDTALHMTARAGHCNVVSEVTRIAQINDQLSKALLDQNIDGETPLHLAVRGGHCDVVTEVMKIASATTYYQYVGVMFAKNTEGDNPLHVAIKCRQLEAAKIIHDTCRNNDVGCQLRNISLSEKNKDGKTALDLVRQYEIKSTELFIFPFLRLTGGGSYFADIEMRLWKRTFEESQEFSNAISVGYENVVYRLLEETPSLMQHIDTDRGTAFHEAARRGNVSMIRSLVVYIILNYPNPSNELARLISARDGTGCNPLHIAINNKDMSVAFYLTEVAQLAAYQVNHEGVAPLYLAVEMGFRDLVKFMIDEHESSLTMISQNLSRKELIPHAKKASLPHAAIKANNTGMLQDLMERLPFLIDSQDTKGWMPLSYAASKGHLDQLRYLLTTFPDSISKRDKDGSMPIHKAIARGHIDVVKEMIAHCPLALCDIDRKGRTTLHIATKYRKADILSYLLKENDARKIRSLRDYEGKTYKDLMTELKNIGKCNAS